MKAVPPLNDLFNMAGMSLPSYLKGEDSETNSPVEAGKARMKILNMRKVFYLVLSLVIVSCTAKKEQQEKLAFIDVTKEYPEKKIEFTEIADVFYLRLNSKTDDYLYKDSIDYVTEIKTHLERHSLLNCYWLKCL